MIQKLLGTVNNQEIHLIEKGNDNFISLKQICKAIDVPYNEEIYNVMNHWLCGDKQVFLEYIENNQKVEGVALPLTYMLGYIAVLHKNSILEKSKSVEIAHVLMKILGDCNSSTETTQGSSLLGMLNEVNGVLNK